MISELDSIDCGFDVSSSSCLHMYPLIIVHMMFLQDIELLIRKIVILCLLSVSYVGNVVTNLDWGVKPPSTCSEERLFSLAL